jgi:hypothetical protein
MATTTKAAGLVPARELSAAVDKAVKIAAERHKVSVSDFNEIANWELVGRRIRDAALAQSFASEVAGQLGKAGIKVEPGTMTIGKKLILCGFYERSRIPQVRQF